LRLAGVEVRDGSCGLSLGDDAHVEITGCIVSGNSWHGILLENYARATITYCGISGNDLSGIMLTNFARATIANCTISENEMDGIVLADTVQAEITRNRIVGNGKFGIGLYRKDCDYEYAPREFTGHISGSGNFIPGRDEPGGSNWMALCPAYPGYPWPEGFLKE
ncbi:MAG: right-handed parallel beta-helix repeat-containing protein, partial [Candidatus Bipolaricaulota bacterium]|nr:right-handed parallel beta-helix repeat-containing protein [Candidatus Bipolaricaulota bacterium]